MRKVPFRVGRDEPLGVVADGDYVVSVRDGYAYFMPVPEHKPEAKANPAKK